MKIHRWQPTGYSPCGRKLVMVAWNEGQTLDYGVTCEACKRNPTRVSLGFGPAPFREEARNEQ